MLRSGKVRQKYIKGDRIPLFIVVDKVIELPNYGYSTLNEKHMPVRCDAATFVRKHIDNNINDTDLH